MHDNTIKVENGESRLKRSNGLCLLPFHVLISQYLVLDMTHGDKISHVQGKSNLTNVHGYQRKAVLKQSMRSLRMRQLMYF